MLLITGANLRKKSKNCVCVFHAQKEIVREKEMMIITVNKICIRHTDIFQPKLTGCAQLHSFACLSFILDPLPSLCDHFELSRTAVTAAIGVPVMRW